LVKLNILQGSYVVMDNFDVNATSHRFTVDEMEGFQDIINDIMGTSEEVDWSIYYSEVGGDQLWRDDDNAGVWDDSAHDGDWDDILIT
jgi:hypothetical protein